MNSIRMDRLAICSVIRCHDDDIFISSKGATVVCCLSYTLSEPHSLISISIVIPAFPNWREPPKIQNNTGLPAPADGVEGAKTLRYKQSSDSTGGGLLKTYRVNSEFANGS
jgi:hypothetical protein